MLAEPDLYGRHPGWSTFSGKKGAEDYDILIKLLGKYPEFDKSVIVGPDPAGVTSNDYFKEYVILLYVILLLTIFYSFIYLFIIYFSLILNVNL